jgi:hypothetical protein
VSGSNDGKGAPHRETPCIEQYKSWGFQIPRNFHEIIYYYNLMHFENYMSHPTGDDHRQTFWDQEPRKGLPISADHLALSKRKIQNAELRALAVVAGVAWRLGWATRASMSWLHPG